MHTEKDKEKLNCLDLNIPDLDLTDCLDLG